MYTLQPMKLIADNNTNVTNQLEILESLVTWPASFKKNIPANKNGCRALSIDFVGHAALEIQILYTWCYLDSISCLIHASNNVGDMAIAIEHYSGSNNQGWMECMVWRHQDLSTFLGDLKLIILKSTSTLDTWMS